MSGDSMECSVCGCHYSHFDFNGDCPCCADGNRNCGDDLSDLEGGAEDESSVIAGLRTELEHAGRIAQVEQERADGLQQRLWKAQAELEAAKAERDALALSAGLVINDCSARCLALTKELTAARAEIERLKELREDAVVGCRVITKNAVRPLRALVRDLLEEVELLPYQGPEAQALVYRARLAIGGE